MPRSTQPPKSAAAANDQPAPAAAASAEVQVLTDLVDIHAQLMKKLQTASRAAKGDKELPDLIREAKEFELAGLTERATLLNRARDAAVKRFEDEHAALSQ